MSSYFFEISYADRFLRSRVITFSILEAKNFVFSQDNQDSFL